MTDQLSGRAPTEPPVSSVAVGFTAFAAAVMMMTGAFQAFHGLVALLNDDFYVVGQKWTFSFDLTSWGWVHLLVGALVAVAGFFVLRGGLGQDRVGGLAGLGLPGRHRPAVIEPGPGSVLGDAARRGDRRRRADAQLHLRCGHRVEGGRKNRGGLGFAASTDVLLRHRHLLDGSVVRAQRVAAGRDRVDAALLLPVRIKRGKVVAMPDDHRTPDLDYATLGLSMTGDDLTGSFTEQKGAVRSFAMLRDAVAKNATVLVTAEPFLGTTPRVYGGRWTRTTPLPPADSSAPRRQVPLDVVLAGGD